MRICFYCDKEIEPNAPRYLLGIERPYCNLWFHKEHYKLVENNTREYLTINYEKLMKFIDKKTK